MDYVPAPLKFGENQKDILEIVQHPFLLYSSSLCYLSILPLHAPLLPSALSPLLSHSFSPSHRLLCDGVIIEDVAPVFNAG